jgi:hypothetical protein
LKTSDFFSAVNITPTWTRADLRNSYFSCEILIGNEGKVYESNARLKIEPIISSAHTATSPEELIERLKILRELDDIHCGKWEDFTRKIFDSTRVTTLNPDEQPIR